MKGLTFGIVTGNPEQSENQALWSTLQSIAVSYGHRHGVDVEILVIGGNTLTPLTVAKHIPFDETQTSKAWITRKKNILVSEAKHDTIILMHDYLRIHPLSFLQAWRDYDEPFDVAMNPVLNYEGTRHSDWVIDPYLLWDAFPDLKDKEWNVGLPYEFNLSKIQYISGNFWVAKTQFMQDHPLNEDLLWGDAEDIEWSRRVRQHTEFKFNPNTWVTIQKPGKWAPGLITQEHLDRLVELHYG